ncbi:hypothetical protein Ciccas_011856 [Cichlidogyrus casuarinus]|uniref:Uncharacterized protein n=1 Tax=Cichlidogyrus casuarinus TaxID=1844966 RepID=A0ABD2PT31_9PLAT
MPLSGLNVWSMVHHDTLVLTLPALNRLEERLLTAQRTISKSLFSSSFLAARDSSGIDATPIKKEPDWQLDRDWSEDDTCPYDIEQERHFTGSVNDLAELKKRLA